MFSFEIGVVDKAFLGVEKETDAVSHVMIGVLHDVDGANKRANDSPPCPN